MSRTQSFSPPQRLQNSRSRSCKKTHFAPQVSGCVLNTVSTRTYYTYITGSHLRVGAGRGLCWPKRFTSPLHQPLVKYSATKRTWCVLVHDLPTESSVWHQPKGRVLSRCSTATHSLQYTYLNDLVNLNEFSGASLQ